MTAAVKGSARYQVWKSPISTLYAAMQHSRCVAATFTAARRWIASEQGDLGAQTGKHDRDARPLPPSVGGNPTDRCESAGAAGPGVRCPLPSQGGGRFWVQPRRAADVHPFAGEHRIA